LQKRSTEVVKYIYEKTKGEIPIIASGGIFTVQMQKKNLTPGIIGTGLDRFYL
jgi:dihydroorotate dehydrogenase